MATLTRNPTSDEAVSGSWTGSAGSRYTLVDDYPDSSGTDFLTHGTTAGNITFGFSAFNVPSNATVNSVTVRYYDKKNASQACNIGGRLKVNGVYYTTATHNPANGTWTARSETWATNPNTGANWTPTEVNGLTAFGVNSTDASPTIDISSIQIEVDYTVSYTLTAESGTLSLTGAAVGLTAAFLLTAASGSYALAGTDATLTYTPNGNNYTMPADAGSFALSGTDAGLLLGRKIASDSGTYVMTGADVALKSNRVLTAGSGTLVLSGSEVALLGNKTLPAASGTLTLTGTDATLTHNQAGGYTLAAEAGVITLSGTNINLLKSSLIALESGSISLTGTDATLTHFAGGGTSYTITCEPGSLTLTGSRAFMRRHGVGQVTIKIGRLLRFNPKYNKYK